MMVLQSLALPVAPNRTTVSCCRFSFASFSHRKKRTHTHMYICESFERARALTRDSLSFFHSLDAVFLCPSFSRYFLLLLLCLSLHLRSTYLLSFIHCSNFTATCCFCTALFFFLSFFLSFVSIRLFFLLSSSLIRSFGLFLFFSSFFGFAIICPWNSVFCVRR